MFTNELVNEAAGAAAVVFMAIGLWVWWLARARLAKGKDRRPRLTSIAILLGLMGYLIFAADIACRWLHRLFPHS